MEGGCAGCTPLVECINFDQPPQAAVHGQTPVRAMGSPHICDAARAGDIPWIVALARQGNDVNDADVVRLQ